MATVVDMDALIGRQRMIIESTQKTLINFKKDADSRKTEAYFRVRLSQLENLAVEFRDNDRVVTMQRPDHEIDYIAGSWSSEYEETYLEAISVIETARDEKFPKQAASFEENEIPHLHSTLHPHNSTHSNSSASPRLQRIELPSFTGLYREWPSFRDIFVSLIHLNNSLSDVEKFHYLKGTLAGEPALMVRHLTMTAANYKAAWKLLDVHFTNERELFKDHMGVFTSLPHIASEDPVELRHLLNTTREFRQSLNEFEIEIDHCDPMIVFFVSQKLPAETAGLWETKLGATTKVPKFRQLESFLDTRIKSLDAIEESKRQLIGLPASTKSTKPTEKPKLPFKSSNSPVGHPKKSFHVANPRPSNNNGSSQRESMLKCCVCGQGHILRKCPQFLTMSTHERQKTVHAAGRCSNCLAHTHTTKECHSKYNCRCGERHHSMLHIDSTFKPHTDKPLVACHSNTHFSNYEVLLSTAIIRVLNRERKFVNVRALIDSGSQATLISEQLVNTLDLPKTSVKTNVSGISGVPADSCNHVVQLTVGSRIDHSFVLNSDAFVLKRLTGFLPNRKIPKCDWPHLLSIELADPTFDQPAKIDIILGAEFYSQILKDGLIRPCNGSPTAQNTYLGWLLFGAVTQSRLTTEISSFVTKVEINRLLTRFWEIESVSEIRIGKPEDRWCERFYTDTVRHEESGRFVVRLPFRSYTNSNATLGRSRLIALNQFAQLERKFTRDFEYHAAYSNCIREYFEFGQIEPVSTSEQQHCSTVDGVTTVSCCYLPQHAIIKEQSSTTKLRVVFDASRKTSNGASLNDVLLPGPALQNDLQSVLTNWRFHFEVASADLKQMFRQILVDPRDAQFQRIFWRFSPDEPLGEYYLKTVTFGTTSAPFLAIRTIQQLATECEPTHPLLSKFLKKAIYVDDLFFGADSVAELQSLITDAIQVFASAGFELRKWISNNDTILQAIPVQLREITNPLALNEKDAVKTLGLYWQPGEDAFCYKFNFNPIENGQTVTKRSVLSTIARLFDPLGFISPVVMTAKCILRKIWLENIDWDDSVSKGLEAEWTDYAQCVKQLVEIRIPRWFTTTKRHVLYELHGFCDASKSAYAACIYLRTSNDNIDFHSTLIVAKTKIAPIKYTSTPRLELLGAELLADLFRHTLKHIQLPVETIPVYAWTDAEIVLYWLRGDTERWEIFVNNRVLRIREVIKTKQWRHVPTLLNPADCASRGLNVNDLIHHPLWWSGPPFLRQPSDQWPVNLHTDFSTDPLVRVIANTAAISTETECNILLRFSRFDKLLRTTALVLRFRAVGKGARSKPFTVQELNEVRDRWIHITQMHAFGNEIVALKNRQALPIKSKILSLSPFLDENGFIRVGGRLQNSLLTYDEKHPLILPAQSHFTTLLIKEYHRLSLHGGTQLLLCLLRKRYWILNARNTVRFMILKCMTCFRLRAKAATQQMGILPHYRVRPSICFYTTGVDFAGPIQVSVAPGRGRAVYKGYIAVFVCLAVKAVHLEVVSDLTTGKFLEALQRFTSRRGLCGHIHSDNGTSFVGATNQLKRDVETWKNQIETEVMPYLVTRGIQWHFIPPGAPEMGGIWESKVKLMKHHLKRICGDQTFMYEEWSTFVANVEACLNSRPLCPNSADIDDLTVLTPGHFLIGDALLAVPQPSIEDRNVPLSQRFARLTQMKQQFWRRWSADYLNLLQSRPKWMTPVPNIQPGTLVLMKDDRMPPMQWPLGRIVSVSPGQDGLVRVVTLRTRGGLFTRSIKKICRLPFETPPERELSSPNAEPAGSNEEGLGHADRPAPI